MRQDQDRKIRQAVVIVHGMGEQRPLDALNGFIHAALPPDENGKPRQYISRPERVTESYESRRYLVPAFAYTPPVDGSRAKEVEHVPQTEVYEYHWAHLMQGNRLDDMATTFKRMMFQGPWAVPSGLKVVWALSWLVIAATVWAFWRGPLADIDLGEITVESVVASLVGGGLSAIVLTYVIARLLPSWITTSFVDVARYLDTSPRSYEVRRLIRKGMVDLLEGLHRSKRYQRIVVVAHSLGAYIAYDGIAFLWTRMNKLHDGTGLPEPGLSPPGLEETEAAASALKRNGSTEERSRFRRAQRQLWTGLRRSGNPWLITDFVSVGTPMYFAHRLYTKNRRKFEERVHRGELPLCPPLPDSEPDGTRDMERFRYSWNNHGRRVVYEGAPFAVVRWTNLWFPADLGFFGDWFGGPLAPLFGNGIQDVKLKRNRPWRRTPGYAHSLYFKARRDRRGGSSAGELRRAMDLSGTVEVRNPSRDWLVKTINAPEPDARTADTTAGDEVLPPLRQPPLKQLEELWSWLATWTSNR